MFPVPKSRVLQIEFVSADPALAARGANAVADLYLTQQEEAKRNEAKAASSWLSQKIEELRGKVGRRGGEARSLSRQSGLFAGANGMNAPAQQLADLNTQLASARARQADAAAKAKALRALLRDGRLDEIPGVAQDELLRRFAEQRVALKAQIALESRTLLPQHPAHEGARRRTRRASTRRFASPPNKVVIALENDAKLAAAQVDSLSGVLAAQSKTVATGNVDEARLRELDLDATHGAPAARILHAEISRGGGARSRQRRPGGRAHHRQRDRAADADLSQKGADGAAGDARGVPDLARTWSPRIALVTDAGEDGGGRGRARARADSAASRGGARRPRLWRNSQSTLPLRRRPRTRAWTSRRRRPSKRRIATRPPKALAERLIETAPSDGVLTSLFAGARTGRTLGLALSAGRALSKRGRTALVDLGVSQDWLSDVVDREGEGEGRLAGLAELLDGRATFEEVIHRDLSSALDIVPAGTGAMELDGLGEALTALTSSYQYVVLHASDWRAPEAAAALEAVAVFVMVAPARALPYALGRLRAAIAETSIVTVGLASGDAARIDRAA